MYVEYNVRNMSLFRVFKVLYIVPSTDIAFAAAELQPGLHANHCS